jgi:peptidoglycan/LPS O-acetylase OafA/YrhL
MIVLISNAVVQTYIFSAVLLVALILSLRKRQDQDFFPISVSQELKGFAILTIVIAHVTYALVSDTKFLHPLSTMAGVGVDLFLLLSGYGLIISSLKKPSSIWQFYKYRLAKIYIPFWICLSIFFILDFWILNLNYGWSYVIQSFLGFFGRANLYLDVNAPFWYFSWIVMYYLIFPWFLIKKKPWLSAILIFIFTFVLIKIQPAFLGQVAHLYRVHLIAFPLGIILGWFLNFSQSWPKIKDGISRKFLLLTKETSKYQKSLLRFSLTLSLIVFILYFVKHSGVGKEPIIEELMSVMTCLALIALFLIKRIEIKAFYWFGFFSYEIYIFHWPLMYRYDFLFKYLPAWLALFLYLFVFLGLGYLLQLIIAKTSTVLTKKPGNKTIDK